MKIKSIKLRNFRQFMNIDFDFSTDKKKNVSIIIAENSTGKTTLMQSIKWCLYGDDETDLDNKNQLLNQFIQQTSNQEKEALSVEVVIEEENVDYTIKRVREVFRKNNKTSEENISLEYKDKSGETKIIKSPTNGITNELNKINRMINQILTREMSRYFLFDGERINNLGTNNAKSRKDIREAIGAINGFNIIDNSLKSLKSMQRFYKGNLSEGTNDKDIMLLNKQMNVLEDSKNQTLKEREQVEIDIINIENKIKKLDNDLSMYDQIQNLTQQRKNLELKITKDQQKVEKQQKEILRNHYTYRIKTLIASLSEKYRKIEFNEEYQNRTISHMQASAIDEILERGTCICGEKLTEFHVQHLLEQKNYQPPISNAQLVQSFKTIIKDEVAGIDKDYAYLERTSDDYIEIIDNIMIEQDEKEKLDKAIGNNDSKEIKEKNTKRGELQRQLIKFRERIGRLSVQAELDEIERSKKEKMYQELLSTKNKNKINQIKYDLVEQSIWILEDRNERDRQARKKQIEEKANEHFSDIIYKTKTISLNDNFEYTVREKDGSIASPSEGERVSISMSLILAIIDSHKERIKEKNNSKEDFNYLNEKEFTIILDAAFANLDNQFSRRISKKLPNSVEQLILFSTDRQYQGAVEDSLREHVGKKYKLTIPTSERENALTNENLEEINLMEGKEVGYYSK